MSFNDRLKKHSDFQNKAIKLLQNKGFLVNPYGSETNISKNFSEQLYNCGDNDITAKFIRYKPDLALILIKKNKAYLCELKSSICKNGFVILEKNSYEISILLNNIGIKTFFVFGDFTYNFTKNLKWDTMFVPERFRNQIVSYKKQYHDKEIKLIPPTKGSNTPFILIHSSSLKKL